MGVLGRTRTAAPSSAVLLAASVVLVAVNLRASVTAVGPIVADIRDDLGLSNAVAGSLTTLPVLAFAGASPLAGPLARRVGVERTLAGALTLLLGGILLRVTGSAWATFAGTALVGVAIAAGNVLLPALIKRDLPDRIGPLTSLYVTVMVACAAIASTVSVPLAEDAGLGWRGALAVWGAPVVVGLVVWLPIALRSGPARMPGDERPRRPTRMRGSRIAWWVTGFMGLQSFAFFVLVAWLPELLQDAGLTASRAGLLMGLLQATGLVATIAVPVLATRMADQRLLAFATAATGAVAMVGLLVAPGQLALVWSLLVGIAGAATLTLSLAFFALRTRDGTDAAALSGMAQSLGYLFAASGPVVTGALHDATGGWTAPLLLFLVVWVLIGVTGWQAARAGVVGEPGRLR